MNTTINKIIIVLLILLSTTALSQNDLHPPAEIMEIMENSDIIYEISIDSVVVPDLIPSQTQMFQYYQVKDSTGIMLGYYDLSDSLVALLQTSAEAKLQDDPIAALELYQKIIEYDSNYNKVYTWIGNTYYMMNQLDSAEYYFKKALRLNPIDYQAHWFLADTYYNLGAHEKARQHILRAHLYNTTYEIIKNRLKEYSAKTVDPWLDWSFTPRYKITESDSMIKIVCEPEWLAYTLVKAVWKCEPGYAQSMIGSLYDSLNLTSNTEEKEAIANHLTQNDSLALLENIIADGYINEFIYYEIWAPRYPLVLLTLPENQINRIIEYVEKYH